ncbi:MAG: RluA family pseudouridine synthase [Candidatus Buchananbacteria bacterium]|nr:RluA family pseudouridine synthase [Candidatus Buchananbacteria bacterium]
MKFKVKAEFENQRLDKFLTQKIKDQTRSQIKKIIEQGLVTINGKKATVHQFLKTDDLIEVNSNSKTVTPTKKARLLPETIVAPKIIFENENFLVIDKPTGLLVHPTQKGETNTLADWLKIKYPKIVKVGDNTYRAGIIHRLDRDVSGVMVIAKNNLAFGYLKDQFKKRKVKKEYLAIVYGQMTKESGEINLPIGRNQEGQFVAHPKQSSKKLQTSDKIAKTKYQTIELIKDYSVLAVQILTGRTHQIRAHLFAIGHPIIGDQIYKPKKKIFTLLRRRIKLIQTDRIMLHSKKIGFYNLNNEWVEFIAPVPKKINDFIYDQKIK